MASYDEHTRARWVPEPPRRSGRTAFERDRARVLHSAALRRLAGKTQVVEPGVSDFPRTRLTHSLECAQIGRDLGKALGCDPDLVEAACLAHDLGHPPFGHNGEAALDVVAQPCGGFEGNAQSLRLLTRLEAKVVTPDGRSAGLNLTRAALDAAMKYPWPRRDGEAKFGVYADDRPVFAWIREGAPSERLCFEAQVMDWADDVAYSVHDLEDGVYAGHVDLTRLRDPAERRAVCELTAQTYHDGSPEELSDVFDRLLALPCWPARYDGGPRDLAALKHLTSELIGRFCQAAEQATREAYPQRSLSRYHADLVVPETQRMECALLKGVTAHYVMSRAEAIKARQRELIAELAELIARDAPDTLEPVLRPAYIAASDDRERLRVVVDQIASLTDASALAWHRRLSGPGRGRPAHEGRGIGRHGPGREGHGPPGHAIG